MAKRRIWLIDLRNLKNLSQDNLANSLQISRASYTNIENGLRNPSVKLAKKIADILKFDWTMFFENK